MLYFDGIHLMADSLAELHTCATSIGLKRAWFQDHPRHPHYDVLSQQIASKALNYGARHVSTRTMLRLTRQAMRSHTYPDGWSTALHSN